MYIWILLIPLAGTVLGAACVFIMKGALKAKTEQALTGFAAGVMVAASVWSLLIPSLDFSENKGFLSFAPAVIGFWIGILFLFVLDMVTPHLHNHATESEGPKSKLKRTTKLVLAVTLHNLPEGMAVGISFAGYLSGEMGITLTGVMALAIGIAIQNFPEGAIVSMPMRAEGMSRRKSFAYGALSGIVEPLGAFLTIILASAILPAMPYMLSFAAGAMMYVVVEELVPEMSQGSHSNIGTIMFAFGFTLMMALDVALG